MTATLLAGCDWVVTCDVEGTVHRTTDVLIEDGAITMISAADAEARTRADEIGAQTVDCRRKLLLPGLINLHTHTPMTLLRGLAEDVDLQGFLAKVFAAEGAVMDPDTVRLGAELGGLEALRSGTTTTVDMYFHHREAHQGALAAGSRHVGGPVFFDFPGPDGLSWSTRMEMLESWPHELAAMGGPVVPQAVCPHGTYTVSPEHLTDVASVVSGWDRPLFNTHVSENSAENAQVLRERGCSPTAVLHQVGILDAGHPVVFGHGVHLSDTDVDLLNNRVSIAHCPASNLKLASGALNWTRLRAKGIRLGIGTDGCSSSNDLDLWAAMRLAALLSRLVTGDPAATSAREILQAATLDGARALGMEDLVGSIEPGKRADLVLLDLDQPHLTPIHDIHALLVFAAGRGDVTDVFVDGEHVVAQGHSTRVDEHDLFARCHARGSAAARAAVEQRS